MYYRIACSAVLTLLIAAPGLHAAVTSQYPVPSTGAAPTGIVGEFGEAWFTEFEGNKIARVRTKGYRTSDPDFTEFAIPTPNSGPLGIVAGPGGYWFTQSRANKIGRVTRDGTFKEYPIPTPASAPRAISEELWFTEFEGNKVGRVIFQTGSIVEYEIPTERSGPSGIVLGPDGNQWFTEFRANKIGRITSTGSIQEFAIPTPNSGPLGITRSGGTIWFTESNANKIGRITPDGAIVEFDLPTPDARPTEIRGDWFIETLANRIGHITYDGIVTEYVVPGAAGSLSGLAGDFRGVWFTDSVRNKVGLISPERLVIIGAGWVPPWDADIDLANRGEVSLQALISQVPRSLSPCGSCPEWRVSLPPFGTGRATGQNGLVGVCCGGPGIRTLYVVPLDGFDAPTVAARVVQRARPSQATGIPVVHLSTIDALDPAVLTFPSASRSAVSHSNLILSEVSWYDDLDVRIEAFAATGEPRGVGVFRVVRGFTLFLADVLAQLAVGELEGGQIRVTKTGGNGLMWGLLATVAEDRVSVSLGTNP